MASELTPEQIWEQLDALATRQEAPIRQAFLKEIARIKAELTDAEVLDMARSGDLRPLLNKLDWDNVRLASRRALLNAAADAPDLPFGQHFDAMNPWAIRSIQAAELRLVTGLTADTVAGVQRALTWGLQNGVNPVDTARIFRALIGLDAKRAQTVLNYEGLLTGGAKGQPLREALRRATRDKRFDRSLIRAMDDKSPLRPDQVQRALQRFEERMIKQRAETIARTNTMDALYQSMMERWGEAVREGRVRPEQLRRFWHTAKDERVCPICGAIPGLNPLGVGFSEPFVLPDGNDPIMGPTAHPNCRCVVFIRVAVEKAVWRTLAVHYSGLRRAA